MNLSTPLTHFESKFQRKTLNDELPQYTRELDVDGFQGARKLYRSLTQASSEHPSFHVVAGYAFSSTPTKKGFKLGQYAEITRQIALLYGGKHSKAWHTNIPIELDLNLNARLLAMTSQALWGTSAAEKARTESRNLFRTKGSGYMAIQSTQPQTLGYGLADSPVGLLAWIYEKLVNWTDGYKWGDDEGFTHLYIGSLMLASENTCIPLGYSYFPKEISLVPLIKPLKPSNVFESQHPKGGHFAATEVPELLVSDFGKGGPTSGVVAGHSGYD
ncbi:hypothetical protein M378DRAFT_185346 [Amanita muscaria Koide BX008]|uniref:Uncharacterized protein n=1 Tax=Amanita muscaria (strain Koide BX008) TaxID=946122 RepID=A0A0C2XFS8_AMAMK|nr:hypothetical protein M378DRAFT_185346 [Amanita muscaria Koide BX008]